MSDQQTPVEVNITVKIGDETRTFEAVAVTSGSPARMARAMIGHAAQGVVSDVADWLDSLEPLR